MNKLQIIKSCFEKNISILQCPLCSSTLHFSDDHTIACKKRHSFDISSKGYVNFFPGAKKGYKKELFVQRRNVCAKGLFDQLLINIEQLIKIEKEQGGCILDAGCGEGSHLSFLTKSLGNHFLGIGIDISKEAIGLGGKNPENLWLVADLSKLPIKNDSLDILLNILSPANYTEFKRILKRDGLIIKVVPGREYLKEIREFFYRERLYDSSKVSKYSEEKINILGERNIFYKFKTQDLLEILNMTPLSNNLSSEEKVKFIESGVEEITVDFQMIWGNVK